MVDRHVTSAKTGESTVVALTPTEETSRTAEEAQAAIGMAAQVKQQALDESFIKAQKVFMEEQMTVRAGEINPPQELVDWLDLKQAP